MGYYRRGYSWEQVHYMPAPVAGWNPDVPPSLMPETEALVLQNLIPRAGRVVLRGPVTLMADLTSRAPLNVMGAVRARTGMLIGQRATNNADPAQTPRAATNTTLSTASTTLLFVSDANPGLGTVSTVVTTRDQIPGFQWINFDGLQYGISADSAGAAVHDANSLYSTAPMSLLTVSPAITTATAPTIMTSAPKGALDLAAHLSRIWLIGGCDTPGGSTTHSSTALFFTNPIASGGGSSAADWQDPVTGLTNQIVMDKNGLDAGVGLAKIQDGLIILRRHSVWILRGTTTSSFTLRLVSTETGCTDPRSIVETDHGVYFLSDKGLMMTNGIRVQNVSGPVKYTLQNALALSGYYGGNVQGESVNQCALLRDGSIVVSCVNASFPYGNSAPVWCGCYDPSTGAWWQLTSPLWAPDFATFIPNLYPGVLVSFPTNGGVYSIGDKFVTALEDYRTYNTGITGTHAGNNWGWFDDSGNAGGFGGRYVGIPAQWTTRAMSLDINAIARKQGQAKRYFLDYISQSVNTATGWTIQPIDPTFSAIGSSSLAPGLAIGPYGPSSIQIPGFGAKPNIQRWNQDYANEVTDLAFQITSAGGGTVTNTFPPSNAISELFGVGVEFQPTRDVR